MKLWEVATGKCLKTWEFLTAVKRVMFSCVSPILAQLVHGRYHQVYDKEAWSQTYADRPQ